MHDPNHNASPFNSIPPVIALLVALIVGIELVLQAGASGLAGGPQGIGWRGEIAQQFGFSDALFEWMRRNASYPLEGLWRFVTYPFIHYEAMHAIFGAVLLLAMGKFVAERFSIVAVLVIFFGSAAIAALGYSLSIDQNGVLIGAYPPVYGLIGAYTWVLLTAYEQAGESRLKAFQLIGILVALQFVFNLIGGGGKDWVADLWGFAAGFALSIMLSPGGISRAMERLRQR